MVLPHPPPTQAITSKTFRPPPLDGSLTVPEIYDWHLKNTPNHPLFEYVDDDGQLVTILWPRALSAMYRMARIMRKKMGLQPDEAPPLSTVPAIVAIVAPSETITYFTIIAGITRAGFVCFPISPRNSAAAVAHLVLKTDVAHILVGRDQTLRHLVDSALSILEDSSTKARLPVVSDIPIFEDLFMDGDELQQSPLSYNIPDPDSVALILHSSGSTAFPKPIRWTHATLNQMALIPYFGERDLCGQRWALHSMPMFHGMGVLQTLWAPACGLVVTAFKPRVPPTIPIAETVIQGALDSESDIIFCVPSFVEAWAKSPEIVDRLSKISGILYGGGPLNRVLGDFMTSKGVTIFILYGCTEAGIMSPILPRTVGSDWEYFRVASHMKPAYIPDGKGCYELILKANITNVPAVLNTTHDGIDAYATSDLLQPHPSRPGYWRVYGRVDDQIMHNTGEKTNPGPLENIMNQDPHVLSSVMFGRGRFQPGIIIDPKPQFKFDPANEVQLADFRNKIWPSVERLNDFAPQHSRLFKECVLVALPTKPFTYTAKSTVRRQAVIADYEGEIDTMYAEIEKTTQADITPPAVWDQASTVQFVRKVVSKLLVDKKVRDEDDVFGHGCDSLQATWIRNSILHALRTTGVQNTRKLAQSFVYQYPSIIAMSTFIYSFIHQREDVSDDSDGNGAVTRMLAMASKYSDKLPQHSPTMPRISSPDGDVVLLTGTTGGLGCSILVDLVNRPDVKRVFALNRSSPAGIKLDERQHQALMDRGLDTDILTSDKVTLLEGDTRKHDLGLSGEVFSEIRDTVTHIIHNAWRVDFNLKLSSFEENIRGLRHLVDLALSSPSPAPPPLLFASSIGVFQNPSGDGPMPEAPIDPEVAVGTGYAESKWVGERLLQVVSERTSLRTISVRIGQVCGGKNGSWNTAEWFPSLVRSGVHLRCLPKMDGVVSWIPLDIAASAIVDFCKSDSPNIHLVHTRPVAWNNIAKECATALDVPLVSYAEWLSKLESSAHSATDADEVELMKANPALRILDFYRSGIPKAKTPESSEVMGFPSLAMSSSIAASSRLAPDRIQSLEADDIRQWMLYWRRVGFLPFT